ncbi:MAG: hypothetical protein ACM3MG_09965, partial [Bacillota bacterium]
STGKGFSHVGLIEIKTDPESGISMPWVWDVYPSTPGLAGGRYIGIEAFAPQEKSQKIGFSRYNPTAFYNYYKTQKARDGYKPFIWKTFEFDSVNNGERLNQSNRRYNVATIISKSDVDSLLTYKSEDANTWYYNEIIPRVLTEMKSNITSERAVLFAKSFINMQDTSYCSQAIVLAYLKGVNIDPQPVHDDWKRSVNLISHLMPKIRSRLNLNERIISPSGFMWQAGLSESPATIYLDTMTPRNSIYSDNLSWISE